MLRKISEFKSYTLTEQVLMKFIWKNKRPRIAKAILSKKSEARDITIPELQLYYKAIVKKKKMA